MTQIKAGNHEFFIEDSGNVIGKIEFTPSGTDSNGNEIISVNHTEVNGEYSGQGLARQLVDRVVDYAREGNKKIVPVCSYVKNVFEKNEEFKDVVAK